MLIGLLLCVRPAAIQAQTGGGDTNLDDLQRALDKAKADRSAAAAKATARRKTEAAAARRKKVTDTPPVVATQDSLEEQRQEAEVQAQEAQRQREAAARAAYKAVALAWNRLGASAIGIGETIEEARQQALQRCNGQEGVNGDCFDSGLTINPGAKYCYALSRDTASVSTGQIGADLATARETALAVCSRTGTGCTVLYAGCNGP